MEEMEFLFIYYLFISCLLFMCLARNICDWETEQREWGDQWRCRRARGPRTESSLTNNWEHSGPNPASLSPAHSVIFLSPEIIDRFYRSSPNQRWLSSTFSSVWESNGLPLRDERPLEGK